MSPGTQRSSEVWIEALMHVPWTQYMVPEMLDENPASSMLP